MKNLRINLLMALLAITTWGWAQEVTVGIAWRSDIDSEFYTNIEEVFKEAGAKTILLPQVKNKAVAYTGNEVSKTEIEDGIGDLTLAAAQKLKSNLYAKSNAPKVLKGIDAVVFTGGEDISPALLREPTTWHGIEAEKDYNATRDVNDYTLMSYCIAKDISTIGFCRGMQMLGVVSGATVIQDIPTYFNSKGEKYDFIHRNEKVGDAYRDYAPHDVTVVPNSILSTMTTTAGTFHNVPSWHHQALQGVKGTSLKVTGYTPVNNENMIEAIERTDRTLILGLQFHPEAAIKKWNSGAANAQKYMSKEEALKIFKVFVEKVKARKIFSLKKSQNSLRISK